MFYSSEMWSLFNISDSPSLTLYDLEKGVREAVKNIIPSFMIQATVESFVTIGHSFLVCIILLKVSLSRVCQCEEMFDCLPAVSGAFHYTKVRDWGCHIVTYSNTKYFPT